MQEAVIHLVGSLPGEKDGIARSEFVPVGLHAFRFESHPRFMTPDYHASVVFVKNITP
jgi:hypothetical protein